MSTPSCNSYNPVNPMLYTNYDYGSVTAFYSIANSVINSNQAQISYRRASNLYHAMNMDTGYGNDNIIDSTTSQFNVYFLQGIAVVFCIVIFCIACFFTCCLRCCARCSKKQQSYPSSKTEQLIFLIVQLIIYLICFAFILAGVIIFCNSVDNFRYTLQNDEFYTSDKGNIYKTARNGENDLLCAYSYMLKTMSPVYSDTNNEPVKLASIWATESGLSDLTNNDNSDILTDLIPKAIAYGDRVISDLDRLHQNPSFVNDGRARQELTDMANRVILADTRMQNIKNVLPQIHNETDRVKAQANRTRNDLITACYVPNYNLLIRLNTSDDKILNTLNTISKCGYESARWSTQLLTTMQIKINNILDWDGLSSIESTAKASVALPVSIFLLFIFISMIYCLVKILALCVPTVDKHTDIKHRGIWMAHCVRGGFYFSIWVAFVPFMVAAALIWYSQIYAGTCYNMYSDNGRYSFYHYLHYEDMTTLSYSGVIKTMSYGNFLDYAKSQSTMFSALSGQSTLISGSDIPNYVNVQTAKSQVDDSYRTMDLNLGYNWSLADSFSFLDATLNNSTTYFTDSLNNYLPYCTSLNPNATVLVNSELYQYTVFYLQQVQYYSDSQNNATSTAASDTQPATKQRLQAETQSFYIDQFGSRLDTANANLLNNLSNDAYRSNPVYKNYQSTGNMLCEANTPLNGLWASAGMIGIFWIPAAICLFFTSSHMYKMHKRKPITVATVAPVVVAPPRPPAPIIVTPAVIVEEKSSAPEAPEFHEIPINGIEVEAEVSPSMTFQTAPAVYPVIGADSLAIIEGL